jgi:hypothetical protein
LQRLAMILIGTGYGLVGLIAAAGWFVASSPRLNVGEVMGSVLLLGSAGVLAECALLAGSAIGTFVVVARRPVRRVGLVLTLLAGWIGCAVLGWLLWGFWTS